AYPHPNLQSPLPVRGPFQVSQRSNAPGPLDISNGRREPTHQRTKRPCTHYEAPARAGQVRTFDLDLFPPTAAKWCARSRKSGVRYVREAVNWYVQRIHISCRRGSRCVPPVPDRAALGRRVRPRHRCQAACGGGLALPDDLRHYTGLVKNGFRSLGDTAARNFGSSNTRGFSGYTRGDLGRRGPARAGTSRRGKRRRPARRRQPWSRAFLGHADGFGEYPLRGARQLSGGRGARRGPGGRSRRRLRASIWRTSTTAPAAPGSFTFRTPAHAILESVPVASESDCERPGNAGRGQEAR